MSFFDKKIRMKLARSLFTKTSPLYVQYYITARCNMNCEQCNIIYAQADCPEMDIQKIRDTARNLSKIGVCMVLLIGGEPFVRKDLPEIIKAFVDNGIHVRMQTNGLATEKMISDCVNAGGHDISISLDTLDEGVQDVINGVPRSWERMIESVSIVNRLFPDYGKGFFGTVLMPRNMEHIIDVLEFATAIGWWVSLVPCHTTTLDTPLGFRTFDATGVCSFKDSDYPVLKRVLEALKESRRKGFNLYDCDEYIDDIYRFLTKQPIQWRRRNNNICDSPNLYFAIEPDGRIQPCCDYKIDKDYFVYDENFPNMFRSGEIRDEISKYTAKCMGCMYGSYPEITLTARFLKPLMHRFKLFNTEKGNTLKRMSKEEMIKLAQDIYLKNRVRREGSVR